MTVSIINETYDFNGNLTASDPVTLSPWRVVPTSKIFEFDGRQYFATKTMYFKGNPNISKSSKVVVDGKNYEILFIDTHYEIDSDKVHHIKVVI